MGETLNLGSGRTLGARVVDTRPVRTGWGGFESLALDVKTKAKPLLSLVLAALLTGCTFHTPYGECIGFDDTEQPHLVYEVSTWNIVMGALFVEMLIPPVVVALEAAKCPKGRR